MFCTPPGHWVHICRKERNLIKTPERKRTNKNQWLVVSTLSTIPMAQSRKLDFVNRTHFFGYHRAPNQCTIQVFSKEGSHLGESLLDYIMSFPETSPPDRHALASVKELHAGTQSTQSCHCSTHGIRARTAGRGAGDSRVGSTI